MCIAKNGVPPAVGKTVQLNVHCKLDIEIYCIYMLKNFIYNIYYLRIPSPAPDLGPYPADRRAAAIRAERELRGGGLAQTHQLLDLRHRRDDRRQREVHRKGDQPSPYLHALSFACWLLQNKNAHIPSCHLALCALIRPGWDQNLCGFVGQLSRKLFFCNSPQPHVKTSQDSQNISHNM